MMPNAQPSLRDLRQDRSGQYIYIPIDTRLGTYIVPPAHAPSLDRSATLFPTVATVATFLLIGIVPGALAVKLGVLGFGLLVLCLGRLWIGRGLERLTLAPGALVPRSFSWATWAARSGKLRLRLGLIVGVISALIAVPVLVDAPQFSGPWLSALGWVIIFGFFAYASWRGLQSLP